MEAYPEDYIAHNVPLVTLSGLGEPEEDQYRNPQTTLKQPGHGVKISSELPCLPESQASIIREEFLKVNSHTSPWNVTHDSGRSEHIDYLLTSIGRVGTAFEGPQ